MNSQFNAESLLKEAAQRTRCLKIDAFELYLARKTSTKIESKDLQVDSLSRAEDVGLSIRLLRNKKMGFSFTTSLSTEAIDKAIDSASQIADIMPEDPHCTLQAFSKQALPKMNLFDEAGLRAPIEKKIELAKLLESECKKADSRIQSIRSAGISEVLYESYLMDFSGNIRSSKGTLFSGSVSCKAEFDGDSDAGGDFDFANTLDKLDVSLIGKRGAINASEMLGAKSVATMKCPAVFRNDVVADFLDFLSSSFSAEEIDKGRSLLAGKMGQKVFSPVLTLWDDALLEGGMATSPFDGEGALSQKNCLIEKGVWKTDLRDTYYGLKTGRGSSGNASRSIKTPPSIATNNFYLEPGMKRLIDLYRDIPKGILITNLMGVHTANPVTGDFSLGASGILIENGALTRPVRGFAVAGNILQLFNQITDVGNDLRFFGSTGAVSVKVPELSIGGT